MATASEVVDQYKALPEDEKATAAAQIAALPRPPKGVVGVLWVMVVGAFVVTLLVGIWLLYSLIQEDKSTEVIVPIVTAAVGVLAGLLAPSPVSS